MKKKLARGLGDPSDSLYDPHLKELTVPLKIYVKKELFRVGQIR